MCCWWFTCTGQAATAQGLAITQPRRRARIEPVKSSLPKDQALHRTALTRSLTPAQALERAILADMRTRVAHHDVNGPVQRVRCSRLARRRQYRLPFRCLALTGGFAYPFAGLVDLRTSELVWCTDDSTAVDPGLQVPLNPACRR